MALWGEAVRLTLREACRTLVGEIEDAVQAAGSLEEERNASEEAQRQVEFAHIDLANEVRQKVGDAAMLFAFVGEAKEENMELLAQVEREHTAAVALGQEVRRLRADRESQSRMADPALATLEAQLQDTLEVEGSLRFSLLRIEAEAQRITPSHDTMEARLSELQSRLENSRRTYDHVIDTLDRQIASLTEENQEAQYTVHRLEKALRNADFRMQMCDLELQRWRT